MDLKKRIKWLLCILLLLGSLGCSMKNEAKSNEKQPKTEQKDLNLAKEAFNREIKRIKEEKQQLEIELKKAKEYVKKDVRVYDPSTKEDLEKAIQEIEDEKKIIPKMPDHLADIQNVTNQVLKEINYEKEIQTIREKKYKLKESIQKYSQICAPSSSFVETRVEKNPLVSSAVSIDKKNDPYGNLKKEHQYIGIVFFSSTLVNQKEVTINEWKATGNIVVDRGIDGGGSIEIFATEKDAKKRNEYLKKFDGTLLSGGKHKLLGTLVIRTSRLLSDEKQNELEKSIQKSILEIEK